MGKTFKFGLSVNGGKSQPADVVIPETGVVIVT